MSRRAALALKPIERQIFLIRDQKVLIDSDLAALYGVEVRALNQAIKRNGDRFPADFAFRLTAKEAESLRSQIVISKRSRGGRRYLPHVFTEHGAIMAASILNSQRAVDMSIFSGARFWAFARDAESPPGAGCEAGRTGATTGSARRFDRGDHRCNPGANGSAGEAGAADRIPCRDELQTEDAEGTQCRSDVTAFRDQYPAASPK
ncbi:MAG: ORF6N domain-containing protein [Acidobacteriota bacterium]